MPIHIDILENEVLGREYKRGFEAGRREAFREIGFREGVLRMLQLIIEQRFGPIPRWAEDRLSGASIEQLVDDLAARVQNAASLEELLA